MEGLPLCQQLLRQETHRVDPAPNASTQPICGSCPKCSTPMLLIERFSVATMLSALCSQGPRLDLDLIPHRSKCFPVVHSRASARAGEVCLVPHQQLRLVTPEPQTHHFQDASVLLGGHSAVPDPASPVQTHHPYGQNTIQPHRLPHPPQTPEARFKRLHRKCPATMTRSRPTIFTPGASDRVLPFRGTC
jgi:hypothetical protein